MADELALPATDWRKHRNFVAVSEDRVSGSSDGVHPNTTDRDDFCKPRAACSNRLSDCIGHRVRIEFQLLCASRVCRLRKESDADAAQSRTSMRPSLITTAPS